MHRRDVPSKEIGVIWLDKIFMIHKCQKDVNLEVRKLVFLTINVSNSDLDVLCCAADLELFETLIQESFSEMPDFTMRKGTIREEPFVLCTFQTNYFPIEIFAQHIPSVQQYAFRHLLVEHYLLEKHGPDFKSKIVALKEQGIKTEPAFAQLLGLDGDPYMALLQFEREMKKR